MKGRSGRLKQKLNKMDVMLMNPDNITGMQVYEEYEQLKTRHDEALAAWEKQTMLSGKDIGKKKLTIFKVMGRKLYANHSGCG